MFSYIVHTHTQIHACRYILFCGSQKNWPSLIITEKKKQKCLTALNGKAFFPPQRIYYGICIDRMISVYVCVCFPFAKNSDVFFGIARNFRQIMNFCQEIPLKYFEFPMQNLRF